MNKKIAVLYLLSERDKTDVLSRYGYKPAQKTVAAENKSVPQKAGISENASREKSERKSAADNDYMSLFGFRSVDGGVEIYYISSEILNNTTLFDPSDKTLTIPAMICEKSVVSIKVSGIITGIKRLIIPDSVKTIDPDLYKGIFGLNEIVSMPGNKRYVFENGSLYFVSDGNKKMISALSAQNMASSAQGAAKAEVPAFKASTSVFVKGGKVAKMVLDDPELFSVFGMANVDNGVMLTYISPSVYDYPSLYKKNEQNLVLPSVFFGRTVKGLGSRLFSELKVRTLKIPDCISLVQSDTFDGCLDLASVVIDENNPYLIVQDGTLFSTEKGKIQKIVKLTPHVSFADTKGTNDPLSSEKADGKLNIMRHFRFSSDKDGVRIDSVLPSVKREPSIYSTASKKLILPVKLEGKEVISLGSDLLKEVSDIKSVQIPEGVNKIDAKAFIKSSVEEFSVNKNNPYYCSGNDGVLYSKDKERIVCYPASKKPPDGIAMFDSESEIGSFAFAYNRKVSGIRFIKNNVKKIGAGAFTESGIERFDLNEGVRSTSDGLIPEKIDIEEGAFAGSRLKTADLSVLRIDVLKRRLFFTCFDLESVLLPYGLDEIEDNVFNACTCLTNIDLPESLSKIGKSAFQDCKQLRYIVFGKKLRRLSDWVFSGCSRLKLVSLPKGELTYIGNMTFENCLSLKKLTVPEGVEYIGNRAFAGCTSLEEIYLPASLKEIEPGAFEGCAKLRIYTPKKSVAYSFAEREHITCVRLGLFKTWDDNTDDVIRIIREMDHSS